MKYLAHTQKKWIQTEQKEMYDENKTNKKTHTAEQTKRTNKFLRDEKFSVKLR